MKKEFDIEDIRHKLKINKDILFTKYGLSELSFSIYNHQVFDCTIQEGVDTLIGESKLLSIIVDFEDKIGWDFYKLQNELMELLNSKLWLITKHGLTKKMYLIEKANIYEQL